MKAIEEFNAAFSRFILTASRTDRSRSFDWLISLLLKEHRANSIGWLPHASTPWAEVELANDADLHEVLDRYYDKNWSIVRRVFEDNILSHGVDNEAKATFREALDAHEAGLYRVTARALFPEIERVSRIELHGGQNRSFASQKELRDVVRTLLPRDLVPAGPGGLALGKRLVKHLYEKVETPDALAAFQVDPVPNRHAALHGLISYSTRQSSVNALIITDFVFGAICTVKRRRSASCAGGDPA